MLLFFSSSIFSIKFYCITISSTNCKNPSKKSTIQVEFLISFIMRISEDFPLEPPSSLLPSYTYISLPKRETVYPLKFINTKVKYQTVEKSTCLAYFIFVPWRFHDAPNLSDWHAGNFISCKHWTIWVWMIQCTFNVYVQTRNGEGMMKIISAKLYG